MEILQLRYFFESAKNENFAKTAQKYMVTPTSVSATIKRLEKELGCELFHRESNKITLNDNGRKLQKSLSVIFEELDNTIDSITSVSTDTREIKMLVRAMRSTVAEYIIEYKTKHPHISFKTVFDFDETDYEKYDIIIDEDCNDYPMYEKNVLYKTKVRLRVSKDSPLGDKKLTLSQLKGEPFISIGENNGIQNLLIRECKKAGFTPNFVVKSNDIWCNKQFVEAGIGIGLGREYPNSHHSENIKYLNVIDFNEKQTICSYYKKSSVYGNVEHFLNYLKKKSI